MNKRIFCWFLLFSIVLLLGCGKEPVDKGDSKIIQTPLPEVFNYYNKEYGIATKYPSDWTVLHNVPDILISFKGPVINGFAPNVNVCRYRTEEKVSLQEFSALIKETLQKTIGDYKELTNGDIKSPFWVGYYREFTGVMDKVPYKWAQICFADNDDLYLVYYVAHINQYDYYLDDAIMIMENLRIETA